jgi:nucleotide sugar dehydrogenase
MPGERAAVVGIGYVGLPVACILAEQGFPTVGIDIDAVRVEKVNKGICPIGGEEPGLAELMERMISEGMLSASTDKREIASADAVFVCVDTPIDADRVPRLNSLKAAVGDIGENLKKGALVSIESTIPPPGRTSRSYIVRRG